MSSIFALSRKARKPSKFRGRSKYIISAPISQPKSIESKSDYSFDSVPPPNNIRSSPGQEHQLKYPAYSKEVKARKSSSSRERPKDTISAPISQGEGDDSEEDRLLDFICSSNRRNSPSGQERHFERPRRLEQAAPTPSKEKTAETPEIPKSSSRHSSRHRSNRNSREGSNSDSETDITSGRRMKRTGSRMIEVRGATFEMLN